MEYLNALKDVNITFTLNGALDFINNMSFPVATVAIGLLVLLSVQGYKIFKSLIYVISAVGLAFAGHLYLAPRVLGFIEPIIPDSIPIDVSVTIALLCAIIGVLLAHFAHQFIVFCLGGIVGYLIGYYWAAGVIAGYFKSLPFLNNNIAAIIIGAVCALIVAIFFIIAFKHLYIILSSIGFMALSAYILVRVLLPGAGNGWLFAFIAIGAVIGVVLMVHQFDEEEKAHEFKF